MRKRLLRLSIAILALALIAGPNAVRADESNKACPSHLSDGVTVCHNTGGENCSACTYKCDNGGGGGTWNVCEMEY